jgi:hypothetical protein
MIVLVVTGEDAEGTFVIPDTREDAVSNTGEDAEITFVMPHTAFFSETLAREAQPRLQFLGSRTVMKQGLSAYLDVMVATACAAAPSSI